MQKILLLLTLFLCSRFLQAQTIEWSIKDNQASSVDAILKTASGHLLIAVALNEEDRIYTRLYTTGGELLWERPIIERTGIKEIIELPDGRFMYFMEDGEVWEVDAIHENWRYLYDLVSGEMSYQTNLILEVIANQELVRVFAAQDSTCLKIDINLTDLSIQDTQLRDMTECVAAAHFFANGSSLEATKFGIARKLDAEGNLLWENSELVERPFPDVHPHFWNGRLNDIAISGTGDIYASVINYIDPQNYEEGFKGKIIRLDTNGNKVWDIVVDLTHKDWFGDVSYHPIEIESLSDGNLLVTGLDGYTAIDVVFSYTARFVVTPEGEIRNRVQEYIGGDDFVTQIIPLEGNKAITAGIAGCSAYPGVAYLQCLDFGNSTNTTNTPIDHKLKLYPNPTEDYLHLDTSTGIEPKNVIITDANGKVCKRFVNAVEYYIGDIQKGVYYIEILGDSWSKSIPFVKVN